MLAMYKIGVIGDKDSVMGFLALGFDVFEAEGAKAVSDTIDKLAREDYAVIYVTEQAALSAMDTIEKYKDCRLPAIILIPGIQGPLGIGMAAVRKSVERAVGADILFNNEN